jgi:hypothetical protein
MVKGCIGMPETEIVKFAVQLGLGSIFFYLYWRTDQRLQEQDKKHEADIARLYEMRIQELKLLAGAKTDLEGISGTYSKPA